MNYDSTKDTQAHIDRVAELLNQAAEELHRRGSIHDQSKLQDPEKALFDEYTPKLKDCTYGSDEYKAFLSGLKPALDNHYAKNSHHPEHEAAHEQWRDIVGYEGLYQVSDLGRVRSVARVVPRGGLTGDLIVNEIIRKGHVTPKNYVRVQLSKEGKPRNHMVHVLVAKAFIGPPPTERHEVNHKSGIKSNNRLSNIEWVTPSENQIHAYETGLKKPEAKYVFYCEELDIVTVGAVKMAQALRVKGYAKISEAGIWASAVRGGYHYDLQFTAAPLTQELPYSGIAGMDLFDLVEMFFDWKAATERMASGNIHKSIDINAKRFSMDPQVVAIFSNTAKRLGY